MSKYKLTYKLSLLKQKDFALKGYQNLFYRVSIMIITATVNEPIAYRQKILLVSFSI